MWMLVSVTLEQAGTKTDMYEANPQGQLMFDPNGRFSELLTRSDVPKFASNNRESGTPEENKVAMQGSIAFFGTYSVSETDKVLLSLRTGIDAFRRVNVSRYRREPRRYAQG